MAQRNEVIDALAAIAPLELAADWDNVGLLVGPRRETFDRIMTCLTVTPITAQEAIDRHADLIVAHHPVMFRPIKNLSGQDSASRVLLQLIQAGIAIYSPHTAYDNAPGGINDLLAEGIGLSKLTSLRPVETRCKLVAFVPEEALAAVSDALFEAGTGRIGHYRECSYRSSGTGTFFGEESTSPALAALAKEKMSWSLAWKSYAPRPSSAPRWPRSGAPHPYEEPAYDVYPLVTSAGASAGEGRCGDLAPAQSVGDIANRLKTLLNVNHIDLVGEAGRVVDRAGIVCGSGGDFTMDAVGRGAQVLITGEIRFHDALLAQAHQLTVLVLGHYASERFAMEKLADRLAGRFPQVSVWASKTEQDPITRS